MSAAESPASTNAGDRASAPLQRKANILLYPAQPRHNWCDADFGALCFLRQLALSYGLDSIRIGKSGGDCVEVHLEVPSTRIEIGQMRNESRLPQPSLRAGRPPQVQTYNPPVAAEG
jgi:hypothetical protein